jgi:hypothetical protein
MAETTPNRRPWVTETEVRRLLDQRRKTIIAEVRDGFYAHLPPREEQLARIDAFIAALDGLPAPATVAWVNHHG